MVMTHADRSYSYTHTNRARESGRRCRESDCCRGA